MIPVCWGFLQAVQGPVSGLALTLDGSLTNEYDLPVVALAIDRLVVFHLFLIAFVNTFGYGFQQTKEDELIRVVKKIRHNEIRKNLVSWLQDYKLLGQSVYGQELQTISNMVNKEMR